MKIAATLSGIFLALSTGSSFAICNQQTFEAAYRTGDSVVLRTFYIDNRVEVFLNGSQLLSLPGNGAGYQAHYLNATFLPQRDNVVVVRGVNQGYQPGWHGTNPGHIEFLVSHFPSGEGGLGLYVCADGDWRRREDHVFFTHTYRLVNLDYPAPRVLKKKKRR